MNRPLFNHNTRTDEKIFASIGIIILYAFLAFIGIKEIVKASESKKAEKIKLMEKQSLK